MCIHLIATHLKHNLTWKSGSSIRSQHVAMTIELWAAESGVKVMWVKILRMLLMKALLTEKLTSGERSCRNGVNIAAFTRAWGSFFSFATGRKMTEKVHFFSMQNHFNENAVSSNINNTKNRENVFKNPHFNTPLSKPMESDSIIGKNERFSFNQLICFCGLRAPPIKWLLHFLCIMTNNSQFLSCSISSFKNSLPLSLETRDFGVKRVDKDHTTTLKDYAGDFSSFSSSLFGPTKSWSSKRQLRNPIGK